MIDAFPLLYEIWYAASLFLDAGHPRNEILNRVGLDEETWKACSRHYSNLHYANTSWVESAFEREGLPNPEDPALFAHLTAGGSIDPPLLDGSLNVRAALKAIRKRVEANPHIGPFSGVDWCAVYIGERSFPPIRYVHDGHRVRVDGTPLSGRKGEIIEGIDPHSFRLLGDRWFRDKERVYCQGETPMKRFWFVVRGADPESFEVLNERYARDKAAGYYATGRRFPTEEPGTFGIVGYQYGRGQKPGFHVNESHYAKDSRKVYGYGRVIEGAHAPSFQAIGDEGVYFADVNRIYYEINPIEDADRASFTCASERGQYLAFDRNRPYYQGRPLSVADRYDDWTGFFEAHPELTDTWWHRERARRDTRQNTSRELAPLGGPYFSDGERVLIRPQRRSFDDPPWISLDHFDLASFRHLTGLFAADRRGLRYVGVGYESYGKDAIKGADPSTFRALKDHWYQDARQVYYFDTDDLWPQLAIVKVDMPSFTLLGGAYARDAKGLICAGVRKRDIADASRVAGLGFLHARMDDKILYRGKVVPKPGAIDIETAKALSDTLLIDQDGHVLLGARYRKPITGIDVASLRRLNRRFYVDNSRVYALTDTSFTPCEIADRASVEADKHDSIRDRLGRIIVQSSGQIKRVGEET